MPTLQLLPTDKNSGIHAGEVLGCSFTPDNQFVLSAGWDGHLRIWEASSGNPIDSFQVNKKPITTCAVSPYGKQFLCGNLDGILSCWDAATHKNISAFLAHPRPISSIAFATDGLTMATSSWDSSVILWDLSQERKGRSLTGHKDIVAGCSFSADGKSLLSWSHDGSLRVWDVPGAGLKQTLVGENDRFVSGAISPDGSLAVGGSRDGCVKVWELQTEKPIRKLNLESEIRKCFFLMDGKLMGTVEATGRVLVHSLPDLNLQLELVTDLPVQSCSVANSGDQLALGCSDGIVHFVALQGFESGALSVAVTQSLRRTATKLQKFLGKSTVEDVFHSTCPVCLHIFELSRADPSQLVSCPSCQRNLRVSTVIAMQPNLM